MGRALASPSHGPSTLNTPLHTVNCTAFAIPSAAPITSCPKGPGPRAVRPKPGLRALRRKRDKEKVNLCAAAASIITNASTCFASSGHSIPAAPALRIPAWGAMVGGSSAKGGRRRTDSRRCGKVRDRVRGRVQIIGAQAHLRTFEAGVCRAVKVAYDGDAHDRRLR